MTNLTLRSFDIPTITKFGIGFDRMFDELSRLHEGTVSTNYPPYNVIEVTDDKYIVELAVAGYNKESLTITEHDGTLEIKGERPEDVEEYVHKGIAGRKFTRSFALGEYVHVDSADLKDGMLYVTEDRDRKVADHKRPRKDLGGEDLGGCDMDSW